MFFSHCTLHSDELSQPYTTNTRAQKPNLFPGFNRPDDSVLLRLEGSRTRSWQLTGQEWSASSSPNAMRRTLRSFQPMSKQISTLSPPETWTKFLMPPSMGVSQGQTDPAHIHSWPANCDTLKSVWGFSFETCGYWSLEAFKESALLRFFICREIWGRSNYMIKMAQQFRVKLKRCAQQLSGVELSVNDSSKRCHVSAFKDSASLISLDWSLCPVILTQPSDGKKLMGRNDLVWFSFAEKSEQSSLLRWFRYVKPEAGESVPRQCLLLWSVFTNHMNHMN